MSFEKPASLFAAFLIPLLVIPLATCGPAPESTSDSAKRDTPESADHFVPDSIPKVIIRGTGRSLRVGGRSYEPGETRRAPDNVWEPMDNGRRGLRVGPNNKLVSMDGEEHGLKEIHILDEASTTLVYGVYGDLLDSKPAPNQASIVPVAPVVKEGWACKRCGPILVCGVNPQCE